MGYGAPPKCGFDFAGSIPARAPKGENVFLVFLPVSL